MHTSSARCTIRMLILSEYLKKAFCSVFVFSQSGSIHVLAKYFQLSDVGATDSEVVINIYFFLCPQHIMPSSFVSFGLSYDCFQVDMSKCMVAFIDWYHERFDGEGGREKIKVTTKLFHKMLTAKCLYE